MNDKTKAMTKAITQEHALGCAAACVASLTGKSYKQALRLFSHPEYAFTKGYYAREICKALKKAGMTYTYQKCTPSNKNILKMRNIIVFAAKTKKLPLGHFLLKTRKGWMNPWINYPSIKPAKSGFQKTFPGKPQWVIFPAITGMRHQSEKLILK
jgi:hypothetical protein